MSQPRSEGHMATFSRPRVDMLASYPWLRPLLFVTMSISSIVLFEPAPYEFLVISMIAMLFPLGLRVPRALGPGLLLLSLFIVGNTIGALVAGYESSVVRSLSIRVYMVLGWILFASLIASDARNVMRIIWMGYSCAAVLAVFWGIAQYYGFLPGELTGPEIRATGPFKDANVFAPFLVPVALLVVARLFVVRGLRLFRYLALFLVVILGIFLAFSRGAWINFLLSFSVLTLFLVLGTRSKRHKIQFFLVQFLMLFSGALALVWVVDNTAAGQLFKERTALVQKYDVAAGGRFSTQRHALGVIGVSPLGVGPGMSTPTLGMEPHNVYLHVALESGWLGALSMYSFLLFSLWRGFRYLRFASGELRTQTLIALAGVMGVMLQSLFIDSGHWRHFWLLLAMLWGLTAAVEEEHWRQQHG